MADCILYLKILQNKHKSMFESACMQSSVASVEIYGIPFVYTNTILHQQVVLGTVLFQFCGLFFPEVRFWCFSILHVTEFEK